MKYFMKTRHVVFMYALNFTVMLLKKQRMLSGLSPDDDETIEYLEMWKRIFWYNIVGGSIITMSCIYDVIGRDISTLSLEFFISYVDINVFVSILEWASILELAYSKLDDSFVISSTVHTTQWIGIRFLMGNVLRGFRKAKR